MSVIVGVADTHTAVWYLFDDPRLSLAAGDFMDAAEADGMKIAVSAISLAELVYLVEKGRVPLASYEGLAAALNDPGHVFVAAPFTADVAESMRKVPRDEVPDMPDRMIAATGVHLGVPVLSRDGRISSASLRTIW